ncbi:hypothetical protein HPULCUR_007147 [Helicostylum pulchrum]|uniref:Uncharacterized protein n=1 Tax=Helicostylum pulchrum TaxID=562976 RepID=A0ABP9Y3X1_9FUNG
MPTSKLTLQQQQQLLTAACLAVLNSPDTVYPVMWTPFELFVSKAHNFYKNLVYFALAFAIALFSLFVSKNSFIFLAVTLGLVRIYSLDGKRVIRDAARWYWYECADNHEGVRGSNHVPSIDNRDNSCYCSTLGAEDDAGLLSKSDIDGCCYCSSLEGEDAGSHNSGATGHCYCSALGEKDDAGAGESNSCCYCSSLEGEDAGGVARGDDAIAEVGVSNAHVPGETDLSDVHGANDINLVDGEFLGCVDTNLLVLNAGISGDINPAFLETKFLSPPTEKMDNFNTVLVFYPFVEVEKECGGSNTPFSYFKNYSKVQVDSVRRSRLRVRRLIRSRPGVPRCARLRPLRLSSDSSFRCSSSLAEYMEVDSFDDELEKMANFCEPMDIDSFEEMSDRGNEQELVVGNFGSFSFGYVPNLKEGSKEPVVTGAGSPVVSIPFTPSFGVFSPPSCGVFLPPSSNGIFLKEPVPSDGVPVVGTKFETSVSKERRLTPLPEPVVQENLAPGKENVSVSLTEAITSSSSRPVMKVPAAVLRTRPMIASPKPPRPRPTSSSTTATTSARPLVEDPFNSKPLNKMPVSGMKAKPTASTSSSLSSTTTTTTTTTTTKKQSTKSILDALFDDAEGEEEEEEEEELKKKEEKEEKKHNKKVDGRRIVHPKARMIR